MCVYGWWQKQGQDKGRYSHKSGSCTDSFVVWMPHAARGSQNAQETSAQESGGKLLSRQAKWVKNGRVGQLLLSAEQSF